MTDNIDSIKMKAIEEITSIQSEKEIKELVRYMKLSKLKHQQGNIFNNTKQDISIEKLKQEQHYKGIDKEVFDGIVEALDIQESIEELLTMLD